MKRNNLIILAIIVLVIAAVSAVKFIPQKPPKPIVHEEHKKAVEQPKVEKLAVDFSNSTLLEIAPFIANTTGKTLLFNGHEETKISWIQTDIPKPEALKAFTQIIEAHGLSVKEVPPNYLSIENKPEIMVPVPVNYLSSAENVWFELNNKIYTKDEFPYQLKEDHKRWFALIPKSLNDKILAQQTQDSSIKATN